MYRLARIVLVVVMSAVGLHPTTLPADAAARGMLLAPRLGPAGSPAPPGPKLLWSDEFTGARGATANPRHWQPDLGGGWGDSELQSYTGSRRNAALDGSGHLVITARHEATVSSDGHRSEYTSARLTTKDRFSVRYGLITARLRVPSGRGLWPAFWLLGDDIDQVGWPRCGEIDVMELLGQRPRDAYAHLHGPTTAGGDYGLGARTTSAQPLSDGFHVYAIRWFSDRIEFLLDGRTYLVLRRADLAPGRQWVFDKPAFLLLNLAVGGNWPGAPDGTTSFPAAMVVDYVRVYAQR